MNLANYRPGKLFDELIDEQGSIRSYYQAVAEKLDRLRSEELQQKIRSLELLFLRQGITFTVYGDQQGTERVFPFDPFPRIIPHHEWEQIEAGLIQRITALNLFLYDIYHDQNILKDKVIPPEVVFEASHYRPEFVGTYVPKNAYIHVCGTDLIRDRDGRYLVLEDNGRCPSGVSLVMPPMLGVKFGFRPMAGSGSTLLIRKLLTRPTSPLPWDETTEMRLRFGATTGVAAIAKCG
jgi:uncharacterized circularly permuted ATP-grasp superfamily protein